MNCGKSTALIQVDYNYRERRMNTLIIKPATDTKGSDRIISRLDVSFLTMIFIEICYDNFLISKKYAVFKPLTLLL